MFCRTFHLWFNLAVLKKNYSSICPEYLIFEFASHPKFCYLCSFTFSSYNWMESLAGWFGFKYKGRHCKNDSKEMAQNATNRRFCWKTKELAKRKKCSTSSTYDMPFTCSAIYIIRQTSKCMYVKLYSISYVAVNIAEAAKVVRPWNHITSPCITCIFSKLWWGFGRKQWVTQNEILESSCQNQHKSLPSFLVIIHNNSMSNPSQGR